MIEVINRILTGTGITVFELRRNGPACENYIYTRFSQEDGFSISTMVPYMYRRSGLCLETPEEIASYLCSLKQYFTKEYINNWCIDQSTALIDDDSVYSIFFRILISAQCKEITQDKFPQNNNPQKIFQTIKDKGFVLSILRGNKANGGLTRYWLLPIPINVGTPYETMSDPFKHYVKGILGDEDVFERRWITGLLPDHKFPEIRWDEKTPEENTIDMPVERVRAKFQMMTTQKNQQKREICRNCFKTGRRGTIYGINYFYEGGPDWNQDIPPRGKDAEKGCVGCPWYDFDEWRKKLIEIIGKNNDTTGI